MPKVSVIIQTYNRGEFLHSAIESALNQTFADIEIIVSDDKSTDHTREVVKSFSDRRIKYILNQGNKGVSAARNSAILASKGEYIAFLDDDDEWLPHKIQRQVEVLDKSEPNICGVHSNLLVIDKMTGKIIPYDPGKKKFKGNLLNQLSLGDPIRTSTVVIRKMCLDEIGLFDETISYMEDRDLWIRLSKNWDFEYISDPLIKYYLHDNAHLSQNLEAQTGGREKLLERYQHLFKKNKWYYGQSYVELGTWYCQFKKMKKGRKNILKGIKIYPFNAIAYLHFFASLLGPRNYQRLRRLYKSI
jgi:glycosyltransferase involved in cell wall biosynthesis